MFEIQDNNGVIHSGTQEEMQFAFEVMGNPDSFTENERETWMTEWDGDLKLVEVHSIL